MANVLEWFKKQASSTSSLILAACGAALWWASQYGERFVIVEWISLLAWVVLSAIVAKRALVAMKLPVLIAGLVSAVLAVGVTFAFMPVKADAPMVDAPIASTINLPAPSVTAPVPTIPAAPAPRIFVTASMAEIIAPYRTNNTAYQSDQLFAAYKGKWMRLTVTIRDIANASFDGKINVFGYEKLEKNTILAGMSFSKDKAAQLTHLRIGDQVFATCVLSEATSAGLLMDNCEIEESPTLLEKKRD